MRWNSSFYGKGWPGQSSRSVPRARPKLIDSGSKKLTMSDSEEHSNTINAILAGKLSLFNSDNGQRGLTVLTDCKSGEIVFRERLYLWFNRQEDNRGIGLPWGLTQNIATKFPETLGVLQKELKLRATFQPKLTTADEEILAHISRESQLSQSVVHAIYNLVCTYNIILGVNIVNGAYLIAGERIAIAPILAFCNHSCEPNCTILADNTVESFKSKIVGLRAAHDIKAGEEITWSYLGSISGSFEERQRILKERFGFRCNCSRCHREHPDGDNDSG